MKDHSGCDRAFSQLSKAYYAEACMRREEFMDEIMIGMYHRDGGTSGEFAVRWIRVGSKWSPHLEVFDDAWHALTQFPDLLAAMAEHDSEDMGPDAFAELLRGLGIKDRTQRVNPRSVVSEKTDG